MKRKALRIVLLLGFIITICSIVVVAAVRVRNAKESEIHHKIENIPLASSYGDEELTLLKDAVLPERKALKVYLYPEEELLADIQPFVNRMSLLSDQYWRTATILGHYPTENIRYVKTEKGEHYYAVYMTEKGARYYLFFDQQGQAYGYPVYMAKETAYADFQSLKIGDSIEAVEKIDPAAKTYGERFPKLASGQTAEEANRAKDDHMLFTGSYLLTGVHLLKDGVLEIRYAYNDDGGYVIRDMYYDPQFDGRNNVVDILGEENVDEHIKAMDYSYEILPKDYIGDEIVVAEVEADTQQPVLAEDVDWEIRLRIDTGVTKDLVFSKDDFKEEELETVITSRYAGGQKDYGIETIFATGITPDQLAQKTNAGEWRFMTVELTDGNQYTFERTELKEKAALFAWVQNKKYAMTSSDSGISLVFESGTPNDYIFSVKEISFVSDPS